MGAIALSTYRSDLQSALGDRGLDNTRLDSWINQGYYDLAGAVDFEVMDTNSTVATVSSVQTITTPTNALIVKFLKDTTSDNLLGWLPKMELFRRAITPTAQPKYWTRHAASIYLSPVPDAAYNMFIVYKKPPTKLTAVGDVSTFADTWDTAVFQLAVHHALLALGEEQRAVAWLQRAILYIQSRMTETDLHAEASGLGASLPSGAAGLMRRLEGLQGQQG